MHHITRWGIAGILVLLPVYCIAEQADTLPGPSVGSDPRVGVIANLEAKLPEPAPRHPKAPAVQPPKSRPPEARTPMPVQALPPPPPRADAKPWWSDRLSVGARVYNFELRDTRRSVRGRYSNNNIKGNFIGSVWGLDEEQDYIPRLHFQFMVNPYWGLGITYDQVGAKTVDWGNLEGTETSSDGTVNISGPMAYLTGRYPNSTKTTPFVELGWAQYSASFDTNPAWAATAPGYRFEVDDTRGNFLGFGVDIAIYKRCALSLYYRRMNNAEVDARAYFTPGSRVGRSGAFPMEYDMFGLGVTCWF